MEYKTQLLRNRIAIAILTIIALMSCGWLIGFVNLLKSVVLVLVAFVCLIGGSIFIVGRFGHQERFASVVLPGWYGFTFALFTLLGMLLDPRSVSLPWVYVLKVVVVVGIGTFVFLLLAMPVGSAVLRFWRRNFGNPVSRSKE